MITPYFETKNGKLYCGDCLDIMPELKDGIDMVLTDPPYGTTACKWDSIIPLELMWKQLKKLIKPNGAIVLFGSEPFSSALRTSNIKGYKYDWYWKKDRASNHLNAKKQPMRNIETISVFNVKKYNPIMEFWGEPSHSVGRKENTINKGTTTGDFKTINANLETNEKYPRTLLSFSMPHPRIHPTQKPVILMEYLIKTYTNENETVLDFACGSGTTGVACENLNRKWIMIEKEEKYCQIAKLRIQKELKQKTKLNFIF